MMKLSKLTSILIVLFSANMAQAEIHFKQSGPSTTLKIGGSDSISRGPHATAGGEPGVGVSSVYRGTKIGFASIVSHSTADEKGIYTIEANENTPRSHRNMGVFHFAKITDANVYFGDWAQTSSVTDATHQTYYIGKDVTTTLPTDNASYSVTGISQYNGNNLLTGTFDVDFSQKKIEGSLSNSDRTITLESGNLYHANNEVTLSATAKEGEITGEVEGAFFGEEAQALAGMMVFSSDHTKDIGFGGVKNSSEIEEIDESAQESEATSSTDAS
ncbi:Slam-dependent surface lipoprotein [Proteus myxofaciens]|nr:Slam-dependent surface lipoprotein [Proteus myxofaciens]